MNEQLITVKDVGDVKVIYLLPPRIVDEIEIQELFDSIVKQIQEQGGTKMVLNFHGVEFLSSSALGKLITLDKRIKGLDGELVLCGIRETIWKAFEIANLDQRFQHFGDEADALAHV